MADPVYPQSLLTVGKVDQPYGGQPANAYDTNVIAFRDAQIIALETQVVDDQWKGYRFVRAKITSGGIAGDCIVDVLAGSDPAYTLMRAKDQTYNGDTTPWFGILAEPCAAAATARVIIHGVGIPPSITGLAPGTSGELTFDTTTARLRLRVASLGEPFVGYVNVKGYARLFPQAMG